MSDPNKLTPDLMTAQQVATLLQVNVRTVWRMVQAHALPQPSRLTRKTVRWRAEAIRAYLEGLRT